MSSIYEVDTRKITDYLLNPSHPSGGPKCKLFLRFGFSIDDPETLLKSILNHAFFNREASEIERDRLITKRIVEGPIETPGGHAPNAISVWEIVAPDRERFIIAYIREP